MFPVIAGAAQKTGWNALVFPVLTVFNQQIPDGDIRKSGNVISLAYCKSEPS